MSIWTSWVTRTRIGPRGGKGFPWQHCLAITPTTEITNEWLALSNKIHLLAEILLLFLVPEWASPIRIFKRFSSAAQLCPTLCDRMDCSMPGFPVHCQLPELTQTHVHHVSDAIQPSHPLSSPSPPAFNFSQHQGLFK